MVHQKLQLLEEIILDYLQHHVVFGDKVPDSIGNFTQLQLLAIYSNKFSSELLASIGNLRSYEILDIENYNFLGSIPSSLTNLTQLIGLDHSQNSQRGTIQLGSLLINLKNLGILSLSSNRLSLLTVKKGGKDILYYYCYTPFIYKSVS